MSIPHHNSTPKTLTKKPPESLTSNHDFHPNDIVQHFKRQLSTPDELSKEPNLYLYRIIGKAHHTETGEPLMIYQSLYGKQQLYARPLTMFLSEVDHQKYPNAKQAYRFERCDNPPLAPVKKHRQSSAFNRD